VRGEIASAADRLEAEDAFLAKAAGRPVPTRNERGVGYKVGRMFRIALPLLVIGGVLFGLQLLPHELTVHDLRTAGGDRKRGTLELSGTVESTEPSPDVLARVSDNRALSSFLLADDTGSVRIFYDESAVAPLSRGAKVTVKGELQTDADGRSFFVAKSVEPP
jgi:hypothetical protein